MAYCGPRGIRYTEFLGWPDIDRDAAIAWQARDRAVCGGCGTVPTDWHNSFDDDGDPVANELAPVMHAIDVYCAGCAARERHERLRPSGDDAPVGVHTAFAPNPDATWTDPPLSTSR